MAGSINKVILVEILTWSRSLRNTRWQQNSKFVTCHIRTLRPQHREQRERTEWHRGDFNENSVLPNNIFAKVPPAISRSCNPNGGPARCRKTHHRSGLATPRGELTLLGGRSDSAVSEGGFVASISFTSQSADSAWSSGGSNSPMRESSDLDDDIPF